MKNIGILLAVWALCISALLVACAEAPATLTLAPTVLVQASVPAMPTSPIPSPSPMAFATLSSTSMPTRPAAIQATSTRDCSLLGAFDFTFADAKHGWALVTASSSSDGSILGIRATLDAGKTWLPLPVPTPRIGACDDIYPRLIHFANQHDGWLYNRGFWTTHDGGMTWSDEKRDVVSVYTAGEAVWTIDGPCEDQWACTQHLRVSTDRGQTWRDVTSLPNLTIPIQSFTLGSPQDAWLVVLDDNGHGLRSKIIATHDGGNIWHDIPAPCPGYANISAADAKHVWLVCYGIPATIMQDKWVYTSDDGGEEWVLRSEACASYQCANSNLTTIGHVGMFQATSPKHAFVALGRYTLFSTIDGGLSWHVAIPQLRDKGPDSGLFVARLLFVDEQNGWVHVWNYDGLWHTTDSAEHWDDVALPR